MPRLREEDGAIAVIVSLLICFLMVPLAALAVDIGVQRVARRDMQSLADVVALDLSRDIDGNRDAAAILADWNCPASTAGTCTGASDNRLGRSVSRQTTTVGHVPQVEAQLGCTDDSTGTFTALGGNCVKPDAVQVASSTSVDFNLMDGSGGAHRTALGRAKQTACYHLGSFAARFNTNDSLVLQRRGDAINSLLGVNLDVVSYKGLADADVTLARLAATSQIGGVDQLLGGTVTLRRLIAASYSVLNAENEPQNSAALSLLNNPTAWFAGNLDAEISLGRLLGVSTTDNAALLADVNVLDLVTGAIAISRDANGDGVPDNFLSLGNLGLAGVTDPTRSYVNVIQGRSMVCGKPGSPDATGTSSQIAAHLEGDLGDLGLGAVSGLGVASATGGYTLDASVGKADAALVGTVVCREGAVGAEDTYDVRVTNALATAGVDASVRVQGSTTSNSSVSDVPLLTNLLQGLVGGIVNSIVSVQYDLAVTFNATTSATPSGTVGLQVPQNAANVPSPEYPETQGWTPGMPKTVSTPTPVQLPPLPTARATGTITVKYGLLGLLGTNTRTITIDSTNLGVMQPLVNQVTSKVSGSNALSTSVGVLNNQLDRLGRLLGVTLGGVDVFSHYRPTCRGAELIG